MKEITIQSRCSKTIKNLSGALEYENIEQRVINLLENSPLEREGDKQPLRQALFHMLMAVGIMDTMSDEEKKQVIKEKKHFDYFFSTKFNLRNRKRKEKKKPSPHTPYKDKAEKERERGGKFRRGRFGF